jgi:hypothetical protein
MEVQQTNSSPLVCSAHHHHHHHHHHVFFLLLPTGVKAWGKLTRDKRRERDVWDCCHSQCCLLGFCFNITRSCNRNKKRNIKSLPSKPPPFSSQYYLCHVSPPKPKTTLLLTKWACKNLVAKHNATSISIAWWEGGWMSGWVSKTPFLPHTPSITMPKFLCPHKCPYNALTMHAPYNVLTMPSPMHVLTMPWQCPNNALTMPLKMHLQCSHNASPNGQQHNPSYNALAMSLKCSYNALTMLLQCSHNASRNGQQHECSYNALAQ